MSGLTPVRGRGRREGEGEGGRLRRWEALYSGCEIFEMNPSMLRREHYSE
jgi:hypothetical protein